MLKKFFSSYISILLIICFFFSFLFDTNTSNDLSFPIKENYMISSQYGYRTLFSYHFHNGIDIAKPLETPIYPLSDGTITYIGFSKSYGNTIIVSYYNGYKSLYGHTSGVYSFAVGDNVCSNNIIAYIGPKFLSNGVLNGFTTGPHLHFTLYYKDKIIDPLSINYI